jgi:hypothetical protein
MTFNLKKCGTDNSLAARVTPKGRLNTERGTDRVPEKESATERVGGDLWESSTAPELLSPPL